MSYHMRERADGQVEILLHRPVLIGVFPDPDVAGHVLALLSAEDLELPPDEPASYQQAREDVAAAEELALDEVAGPKPSPPPAHSAKQRAQLPAALREQPRAPVPIATRPELSEDEVQRAFARIQNGEKIHAVAADFGLTMGQLRGMWANHKRRMQTFMAQDGQQPCKHCARPFTPSISHPDTCARCSHD